jgi:hypothetical protein
MSVQQAPAILDIKEEKYDPELDGPNPRGGPGGEGVENVANGDSGPNKSTPKSQNEEAIAQLATAIIMKEILNNNQKPGAEKPLLVVPQAFSKTKSGFSSGKVSPQGEDPDEEEDGCGDGSVDGGVLDLSGRSVVPADADADAIAAALASSDATSNDDDNEDYETEAGKLAASKFHW